jgi:hypothetical protein
MSELNDESLRLDGNAAARLLEEIVPCEMTNAQSERAGCGQTSLLSARMLYGGEMGAALPLLRRRADAHDAHHARVGAT